MFERLKGENEVWKNKRKICTEQKLSKSQVRKNEIHGLKDILVRENEKIQREQVTLRFYPRFVHTAHCTCCILKIILGVISDKFWSQMKISKTYFQINLNNKLDTSLADMEERLVRSQHWLMTILWIFSAPPSKKVKLCCSGKGHWGVQKGCEEVSGRDEGNNQNRQEGTERQGLCYISSSWFTIKDPQLLSSFDFRF